MPRKSFWARLPFGVRMATLGLGALALVAGAAGGIVALLHPDTRVVTAVGREAPVVELPAAETPVPPPTGSTGLGDGSVGHAGAERQADRTRSEPGETDRTATRAPRRTAAPAARPGPAATSPSPSPARPSTSSTAGKNGGSKKDHRGAGTSSAAVVPPSSGPPAAPVIRVEQLSETEAIPFRTTRIRDSTLPPGSREVSPGVPGERVLRYEVTYTGKRETGRRLLDAKVTREPQDRVVAFGGQHSDDDGDERPGRDHDEPGDCGLLEPCVPVGHEAECAGGALPEGRLDEDPSLLDLSGLDVPELDLPCAAAAE